MPLDRVEAARLLGLSGDTEAAPALKRMSASRVKFPYPNGKLDLPKECGLALKKLTTGAQ